MNYLSDSSVMLTRQRVICAGLILALPLAIALSRCDRVGSAEPPIGEPVSKLLPADPFQRCAVRALGGEFGPLQEWQAYWYRRGVGGGRTIQGRAKVTSYGPWEPPSMSGGPYCWVAGRRVRLSRAHCAANPEIPRGSVVWTPYGLRFVVDRGGWVKVGGRFTRPDESANFDYWSSHELPTLRRAPYVVLRRGW